MFCTALGLELSAPSQHICSYLQQLLHLAKHICCYLLYFLHLATPGPCSQCQVTSLTPQVPLGPGLRPQVPGPRSWAPSSQAVAVAEPLNVTYMWGSAVPDPEGFLFEHGTCE